MSLNQLKLKVKNILPPIVLRNIQFVRRFFRTPDPQNAILEKRYKDLNSGLPKNKIAMRNDMIFNVSDESVEPFEWFCYRSVPMVAEFDFFLSLRKTCYSFLDIGANHGVFSLAFCEGRPNVRAVSIDPSPLAYPILCQNIDLNPTFNVTPIQIAAGDKDGELRMKLNWHHLEVIAEQFEPESDSIKIVPVRKMDDVCQEIGFSPDLIKIDVEGFELQCLTGLSRILKELHPPLLLEIHPELIGPLGYTCRDITKFLSEYNYSFLSLDGKHLSTDEVVDRIHTNWVICQPKKF